MKKALGTHTELGQTCEVKLAEPRPPPNARLFRPSRGNSRYEDLRGSRGGWSGPYDAPPPIRYNGYNSPPPHHHHRPPHSNMGPPRSHGYSGGSYYSGYGKHYLENAKNQESFVSLGRIEHLSFW